MQNGPEGGEGLSGGNDSEGYDQEPSSEPVLSNVTLVHSIPHAQRARKQAGLRLRTGTAVSARDLLVTGSGASAIHAGAHAALLFGEGESSVASAVLYLNGHRSGGGQLRGGIIFGVEFKDRNPKLRNVSWEANPDPRLKAGSSALPVTKAAEDETATGAAYIGAFGTAENWLQEWTFFGPESECDPRGRMTGATSPGASRGGTPPQVSRDRPPSASVVGSSASRLFLAPGRRPTRSGPCDDSAPGPGSGGRTRDAGILCIRRGHGAPHRGGFRPDRSTTFAAICRTIARCGSTASRKPAAPRSRFSVPWAVSVGYGPAWACAKFRALATETKIGAATDRTLASAPPGLYDASQACHGIGGDSAHVLGIR